MKCIYCQNEKLYFLKNNLLKCAKCKRKFSPKKVLTQKKIIHDFIHGKPANKVAKELNLNYITVKNRYDIFRKLLAGYLEKEYRGEEVIEYDEYIYLPKSKKVVSENIFDAFNFLTFHYKNRIYNIPLPSLHRYKQDFLEAKAQEAYFKEFSKSMMFNKISKIQKKDNLITQFWMFFENEILKYKGVREENFFYYLKECEFTFNFSTEERYDILKNLYLSLIYN